MVIFVYRFWAHYHLSTEVYAGYSYGNILFTWRIRKCLLCISSACHGHFNCIISFCCCWSDCQYCWPNFADCFRENTGPWIENILMLTTQLPKWQPQRKHAEICYYLQWKICADTRAARRCMRCCVCSKIIQKKSQQGRFIESRNNYLFYVSMIDFHRSKW